MLYIKEARSSAADSFICVTSLLIYRQAYDRFKSEYARSNTRQENPAALAGSDLWSLEALESKPVLQLHNGFLCLYTKEYPPQKTPAHKD